MIKYILIFITTVFLMFPVVMFFLDHHAQFYSLGRFELYSKHTFRDILWDEGFEGHIYSYKVVDNYMYIYGKSGITIVSLRPIFPSIIKLPDKKFYDKLTWQDRVSKYHSTLKRLSYTYWPNFTIIESIDELTPKDKRIVEELYRDAKEKEEQSKALLEKVKKERQ
ncbi:hypothetical protein [Veillonella agrestimuris]|uniref:hypothetical protein n=1 Tax=Veillonella agrestimuris TaxID=2941340 RepID=UPI00204042B3|nr:hypothetical protein [Veillonella agrestimuris]